LRRAEELDLFRHAAFLWSKEQWQHLAKWLAGLQSLLGGRPGMFLPDAIGAWLAGGTGRRSSSLLDSLPLRGTLHDLIDFDRLNSGEIRLIVLTVDAETGEDVVFDTSREQVTAEHLRASTSMPVLFDPVKVDGRWLYDGGLSANLPVVLALENPPSEDTLCIAVDLLPSKATRPDSLGEAALRAQDLIFSCQSRHAIQALSKEYRRREQGRENAKTAATTLLHLIYGSEAQETAIKSLDFTDDSIARRWAAGKADIIASLEQLAGAPSPEMASLTTFRLESGALRRRD